jgi:hypothetical protein
MRTSSAQDRKNSRPNCTSKGRVLFVVMVERVTDMPGIVPPTPYITPEELPSKSKPRPAKKPRTAATKKASRDGTKTEAFPPG